MVRIFSRRSRAPGEEPNSGTGIPARWASTATASLKGRFSSSITKLTAPPPLPQPKHLYICRSGTTWKEGFFRCGRGSSPSSCFLFLSAAPTRTPGLQCRSGPEARPKIARARAKVFPFFNKTSFLSCIQNLLKIICNLPDGPYTSQSTRLQSKHSPTIIVIVIATIIIISSLSKSDILLFSASFSNEIIRCLSPFNFASRIPFSVGFDIQHMQVK